MFVVYKTIHSAILYTLLPGQGIVQTMTTVIMTLTKISDSLPLSKTWIRFGLSILVWLNMLFYLLFLYISLNDNMIHTYYTLSYAYTVIYWTCANCRLRKCFLKMSISAWMSANHFISFCFHHAGPTVVSLCLYCVFINYINKQFPFLLVVILNLRRAEYFRMKSQSHSNEHAC